MLIRNLDTGLEYEVDADYRAHARERIVHEDEEMTRTEYETLMSDMQGNIDADGDLTEDEEDGSPESEEDDEEAGQGSVEETGSDEEESDADDDEDEEVDQ